MLHKLVIFLALKQHFVYIYAMKTAEIHLLSDEIINKIAAGEVIERPASAVKELIENAIDAKATRIQVQIEQGGKSKIQVSDNGKGMSEADLDICYLRHTTSKLHNADDLFHLETNGFRGEAVASIAAVSKLTITSANDEGDSGKIVISGGDVVKKEQVQASRGTSFLVEDLFFNTPVRKAFLSSEASETTRITDVIIKAAIAHPEIRFDYKVNDKSVFIGVPGEPRNRIAEAIGSGIAKNLLEVDYTEAGVHVSGFISPTTETKGKRQHHYLFLRHRPIESKMISKAVTQAYEPYGANCKPVSILFLDMPDMEFDVNVHPAKREVRFSNGNLVFLVVTHAIRHTFEQEFKAESPFIDLSEEIKEDVRLQVEAPKNLIKEPPRKFYTVDDTVQDLFSQPEAQKIIPLEPHYNTENNPKPAPWTAPTFFQIANTYIAGEDAGGLLIIDQHGAHTRVLYEQALETLKNGGAQDSQELLFPELIELSKLEKQILDSVQEPLKKLGFYVEPFGGDTFQIRSIPSALPLSRAIKAVHDFLEDYGENACDDMVKIQDAMAKAWAKTNAYQAGDKLKPEEMANLVGQLMVTEDPLKTPYGGPTLMRFTLDELAKKFKR